MPAAPSSAGPSSARLPAPSKWPPQGSRRKRPRAEETDWVENEDGMQLALALSVSEGDLGISNGDADVASGGDADVASGDADCNEDEASSDDESDEYDPSQSRSMDEIYAAALARERKKKRKLQ